MKYFYSQKLKAFTFVEFIVILTIFSIMAGVSMFNFKGFRSNVALEQLAYDIALSMQNIQQRAASGVSLSGSGAPTGQFQGIQFDYTGTSPAKFDPEFTLFRDVDNNQIFSTGDILIDKIKIQYGEYIEDIQFNNTSNFSTAASGPNTDISIMFRRPWFDAYFYNLSTGSGVLLPDQYARITLASNMGSSIARKYIIISQAGQISVK
jgi:type II secretory pathway pseudopilin PulG